MQVDQTRRHQLARGVDGLRGAGGRDLVLDRLDHAPANADVAFSAQRLAGIEHGTALDDEIEFVGRPHPGVGVSGERCCRSRSCQAEKMTARKPRPSTARPSFEFYLLIMRRL